MKKGRILTEDADIKKILEETKTVAVLGMSPKPQRDSHMVGKYLKDAGYRIIPVRPGQSEILGEKAYKSLDDITEEVDMIDVFRNSAQVADHVDEAIRLKPKVFWMQMGIKNEEAAGRLTEAGIDVVMDKCTKVEHDYLCK